MPGFVTVVAQRSNSREHSPKVGRPWAELAHANMLCSCRETFTERRSFQGSLLNAQVGGHDSRAGQCVECCLPKGLRNGTNDLIWMGRSDYGYGISLAASFPRLNAGRTTIALNSLVFNSRPALSTARYLIPHSSGSRHYEDQQADCMGTSPTPYEGSAGESSPSLSTPITQRNQLRSRRVARGVSPVGRWHLKR